MSNLEVPFAIFAFGEGCVWEILKLILGGLHYKLAIHRGFLGLAEHNACMCTEIMCSYVSFDIVLRLNRLYHCVVCPLSGQKITPF